MSIRLILSNRKPCFNFFMFAFESGMRQSSMMRVCLRTIALGIVESVSIVYIPGSRRLHFQHDPCFPLDIFLYNSNDENISLLSILIVENSTNFLSQLLVRLPWHIHIDYPAKRHNQGESHPPLSRPRANVFGEKTLVGFHQ